MLYYLGIADLPSKMAHSIQEMRMCEAFVEAGEDVRYLHGHVLGDKQTPTWESVASFYGLECRFEIKTFRNVRGKTGRFSKVGTLSMAAPIALYVFFVVLLGRFDHDDVIYGRNYYPMFFLTELLKLTPSERTPSVVFEFHDPIDVRFQRRFFAQVDRLVCITEKLAEYSVETYGIDRERILVAPDSVDLDPYEGLSQSGAREQIDIPADEDLVVYTGHCYEGKGVEGLVSVAGELDAEIFLVGGFEEDISRVKREAGHPDNVTFTGFVDPSDVPVYQVAADVLVAPYDDRSREFISPLKLFEYMAAGRPIVASDRDVLREVLTDGENAVLFEAGNRAALRVKVDDLLRSRRTRDQLELAAKRTVRQYTWRRRAENILEFIRK